MDKKALELISAEELKDKPPAAPGPAEQKQDAPPASAVPALDPVEVAGWAAIPKAFGGVLAMALPELRDVYSDAACAEWGAAMVPVAKKFGWNVAGVSPILGLISATVPLALPTVLAVKRARAAVRPKDVPDAPDGEQRPGAPRKVAPVG